MQVFKYFFKVSKKYRASIIVYTIIFLSLIFMMTSQQNSNSYEDFKSTTLNIAVFNHDNSDLSNAMVEYIGEKHTLNEISEDLDDIRDLMYIRKIDYVLIIPENFSSLLKEGNATTLLESYKLPGSSAAQFMDYQINQFISTYNAYIAGGFNSDEAYTFAFETLSKETTVSINYAPEQAQRSPAASYYTLLPYTLMSIILSAISPILIVFTKKEIKRRASCGTISTTKYNISLAVAAAVYAIGMFIFFVLFSVVFFGSDIFTIESTLRILNGFIYTLICLGFSFFFTQFTDNINIISMLTNIIGLGSSFLSGVFVDRSLLSDGVLNIGKFFPSYWYINVELGIEDLSLTSPDVFIQGYGTQILFIIALFSIGIIVNKSKKN